MKKTTTLFGILLIIFFVSCKEIEKKAQETEEVTQSWKAPFKVLKGAEFNLIKKGDNYFFKINIKKDNEIITENIIKKTVNNKTIFIAKNNNFGEYYAVEKNGNLGFYDKEGKYAEAEKIK